MPEPLPQSLCSPSPMGPGLRRGDTFVIVIVIVIVHELFAGVSIQVTKSPLRSPGPMEVEERRGGREGRGSSQVLPTVLAKLII